jgi:hypothetical protein
MMTRAALALLLLAIPAAQAQEKPQADHSDLAKLIHNLVIPLVPKDFEEKSEWGKTAPLPANLRLPRARRTVVMVEGRLEAPEGAWKRTKVTFDEPARNVQVRVTELTRIDKERTRLGAEFTISLHGERQRLQWARGIRLLDLTVEADAVIVAHLDTELTIKLTPGTFPPEISVAPKVLGTKLALKQFDLNRVGPVLFGNKEARDLGEELRGSLEGLMKQYEPQATEKLNEAIAKELKGGKAKLSAGTLLKLNLSEKKE